MTAADGPKTKPWVGPDDIVDVTLPPRSEPLWRPLISAPVESGVVIECRSTSHGVLEGAIFGLYRWENDRGLWVSVPDGRKTFFVPPAGDDVVWRPYSGTIEGYPVRHMAPQQKPVPPWIGVSAVGVVLFGIIMFLFLVVR